MRDQYKVLSEKYIQVFTEDTNEPPPNTADSVKWWSKSIKRFNLPDTDLFLQWLFSEDCFKYLRNAEGLGVEFFNNITDITESVITALDFMWEMAKDQALGEWKHSKGLKSTAAITGPWAARFNSEATKQIIERLYSEGFIPWKRVRDELYKDNPGINIDI